MYGTETKKKRDQIGNKEEESLCFWHPDFMRQSNAVQRKKQIYSFT